MILFCIHSKCSEAKWRRKKNRCNSSYWDYALPGYVTRMIIQKLFPKINNIKSFYAMMNQERKFHNIFSQFISQKLNIRWGASSARKVKNNFILINFLGKYTMTTFHKSFTFDNSLSTERAEILLFVRTKYQDFN